MSNARRLSTPGQSIALPNGGRAAASSGMDAAPQAPNKANLVSKDAVLCFSVTLLLPVALFMVGLAPLNRWLYPLTALLAGLSLFRKRSPWYAGLCIWLFCATPLVRRLADFQSAFDPSNPTLLAPYLACMVAALTVIRPGVWQRVGAFPIAVILACISWGLLLATLEGRMFSGSVDTMKWAAGPLVALHILSDGQQRASHRVLVQCFFVAGPAMAIYGIMQFIQPSLWDAYWMSGAAGLGLDSIGQPEPFSMRVFSTMNSPGPFGAVEMVGMLLATHLPLSAALPSIVLMALGSLLSQYRAVWAGTCVGLLFILLSGSVRDRARIVFLGGGLILAASSLAVVPQMREVIAVRIASLSQLGSDYSGQERMLQYQTIFTDSTRNWFTGNGLGATGASSRLDGKKTVILDSGLLELVLDFGIIGAAIYLIALGDLFRTVFSSVAGPGIEKQVLYRAIVLATFVQIPFGSIQIGEGGFATWVCIGLAAGRANEYCVARRAAAARRNHGKLSGA